MVSSIKVLVTSTYIVGKRRTDVFVSVFCDVREGVELRYDKQCLLHNMGTHCYIGFIILKYFILPMLKSKKCLKQC